VTWLTHLINCSPQVSIHPAVPAAPKPSPVSKQTSSLNYVSDSSQNDRAGQSPYKGNVGSTGNGGSTTDDEACMDYLDWLRWPGGPVCPSCGRVAEGEHGPSVALRRVPEACLAHSGNDLPGHAHAVRTPTIRTT